MSSGAEHDLPGAGTHSSLVHGICVCVLLLCAALIAWPLAGEGFKYYADNPVHLVELESLARGESWSELALCGLPLGYLHSPLWYGAGAGLTAAGIPSDLVYFLAMYVGFVSPSLAIYVVGQERSSPLIGLWVGYLVLVLPASVFGMASALAGMWTMHIGVAFFILYANSLVTERRGAPERHRSALWLTLVALSHHFVLVAAVILTACHLGLRMRDKEARAQRSEFIKEGWVWAVAAAAALIYWGPMLATLDSSAAGHQDLPIDKLGLRLLFPTDIMRILADSDEGMIRTELFMSETLIHIALLVSAGLAARAQGRAQHGVPGHKSMVTLGLTFFAVMLLVVIISSWINLPFLGPLSWRYVAFVHLALGLAALGCHWGRKTATSHPLKIFIAAGVLMILSASWWSRPLARFDNLASSDAAAQMRDTWDWVAAHPPDTDSEIPPRIYAQNSFTSTYARPLDASHVTLLVSQATGRPQTGSFYGVHPFSTGEWTKSGWGAFYGAITMKREPFRERVRRSNVTTIILCFPWWREFMSTVPEFEEVHVDGRFSVWESKEAAPGWANASDPGVRVLSHHYGRGQLDIEVEVSQEGARVLTAVSHHAWWQLTGSGELEKDNMGLMVIANLPPGSHNLKLRWSPPAWPWLGSLLGWLILAGWGMRKRGRVRRPSGNPSA